MNPLKVFEIDKDTSGVMTSMNILVLNYCLKAFDKKAK